MEKFKRGWAVSKWSQRRWVRRNRRVEAKQIIEGPPEGWTLMKGEFKGSGLLKVTERRSVSG